LELFINLYFTLQVFVTWVILNVLHLWFKLVEIRLFRLLQRSLSWHLLIEIASFWFLTSKIFLNLLIFSRSICPLYLNKWLSGVPHLGSVISLCHILYRFSVFFYLLYNFFNVWINNVGLHPFFYHFQLLLIFNIKIIRNLWKIVVNENIIPINVKLFLCTSYISNLINLPWAIWSFQPILSLLILIQIRNNFGLINILVNNIYNWCINIIIEYKKEHKNNDNIKNWIWRVFRNKFQRIKLFIFIIQSKNNSL